VIFLYIYFYIIIGIIVETWIPKTKKIDDTRATKILLGPFIFFPLLSNKKKKRPDSPFWKSRYG